MRATALRDTPTAFGSGSITDPTINDLLEGGTFDAGIYTFSGLTAGVEYQIQALTNDARGGGGAGGRDNLWQVGFSDGVNNLDDGNPDNTENLFITSGAGANVAGTSILNNRDPATLEGETSGNFITGTFIADATGTQSFAIQGTRNAFAVLRPVDRLSSTLSNFAR